MGNIRPKKSLGQHFLRDKSVIDRIVKAAGVSHSDTVIEVGPGTGALTERLLEENPKRLIAVEVDPELVKLLREKFSRFKNFEVVKADATKFDFAGAGKVKVVGNLPYNVSTAIIRNVLNGADNLKLAVFMTQKEVADRFIKGRGKDYGYLSALVNFFFSVKKLFDVPPSSFYPPPKVYSTVFMLKPKRKLLERQELNRFESFLKRAFSNRRKKLKNNLKLSSYPEGVENLISKRAEELSPEELFELFRKLYPPFPLEEEEKGKADEQHEG